PLPEDDHATPSIAFLRYSSSRGHRDLGILMFQRSHPFCDGRRARLAKRAIRDRRAGARNIDSAPLPPHAPRVRSIAFETARCGVAPARIASIVDSTIVGSHD